MFSDYGKYIQGNFTGGDCYIFINIVGSENHVIDHRAVDDIQTAVHKQLSELRDEVQKLTKAISARGGNFLEGWQNDAADTAAHAMKYSKAEVSDVGDSIRKHPTATAAIVLTVVAIGTEDRLHARFADAQFWSPPVKGACNSKIANYDRNC